ncbi:MAG: methyltransferase domain-containing protein [Patescibacteria group bacterium]
MDERFAEKLMAMNATTYQAIADQFSATRKFIWEDFKPLMEYIAIGEKVLDAGCGNGRLYELLKEKHVEYAGLDLSGELIAIAKRQYPELKFIAGNILDLPFPPGSFDVVFCIATLHHLPTEKLRAQAIRQFYKVLRPDGRLVMLNWNLLASNWWLIHAKILWQRIIGKGRISFPDVIKLWKNESGAVVGRRYIHGFRTSELSTLLDHNGFSQVQQYYTKKGHPATRRTGYNLITIAKKA